MIIHVINLDTENEVNPYASPAVVKEIKRYREERIISVVRQSKSHGFAVRFWEGVTSEKFGWQNIFKAFKRVIMYAKEHNLPSVVIAEDDFVLTAPGAWDYYIENTPKNYDLYSGGIYAGTIQENRIINGYSGNTLVMFNERIYDLILSANEPDHLDRWLGNFAFEKKYIVCNPFVVYQIQGYSDNLRRESNYAPYYEGREFFGIGKHPLSP